MLLFAISQRFHFTTFKAVLLSLGPSAFRLITSGHFGNTNMFSYRRSLTLLDSRKTCESQQKDDGETHKRLHCFTHRPTRYIAVGDSLDREKTTRSTPKVKPFTSGVLANRHRDVQAVLMLTNKKGVCNPAHQNHVMARRL